MNVKVCYLLPLIALLGLVSCGTQPNREQPPTAQKLPRLSTGSSDEQRGPVTPTAQAVDLSYFQVPQQLAGLKLDGEISTQRGRTLHYRSEDKKEQLSLTLSGLPAGWDNMPAERAVASYYSEVRQRRVNQALQDSANALTILSETLLDLEGHPSAQAQMRWVEKGRPIQNQSLLVTLIDGVYIRINNASYQQSPRWLLQHGKRALAEFKAAQKDSSKPQASSDNADKSRAEQLLSARDSELGEVLSFLNTTSHTQNLDAAPALQHRQTGIRVAACSL
ncbi:MAG: hypothetical protein ACFE0K_01385 [Alcanivorax sp.]|uniref:hypothetical protein n=1 Tax=Alcanivorax sp. TaxID=1872427 RepID=UPI003DA7A617